MRVSIFWRFFSSEIWAELFINDNSGGLDFLSERRVVLNVGSIENVGFLVIEGAANVFGETYEFESVKMTINA